MFAGYDWTAWLFWGGGGVIGLGALALLYWSLLHDRSRGRRRCPKCWYDMSQSPTLTCSECGRTVSREKKLFKTRRRWRWAIVAAFLALASATISLTPKVRRDGWPSIVPTMALIAMLPWLEDVPDPGGWGGYAIPATQKQLFFDVLYEELIRRVRAKDLWKWQATWLIEKSLRGDENRRPPDWTWAAHYGDVLELAYGYGWLTGDRLRTFAATCGVSTAPKWPRGVPLRVSFGTNAWIGHESFTVRAMARLPGAIFLEERASPPPLGMFINESDDFRDTSLLAASHAPTGDEVTFDIEVIDEGGEVVRTGSIELETELVDSIGEVVSPFRSPELAEILEQHMTAFIIGSYVTVVGDSHRATALDLPGDLIFSIRADLVHNGEVVASGRMFDSLWGIDAGDLRIAPFRFDGDLNTAITLDGTWRLRLTGDQEFALHALRVAPYWDGVVEIPAVPRVDRDLGEIDLYESPEFDAFLVQNLHAVLANDEIIELSVPSPVGSVGDFPAFVHLDPAFQVLANGEVVASGNSHMHLDQRGADGIAWASDDLLSVVDTDGDLVLRLFYDPEDGGWDRYLMPLVWKGDVTVPLHRSDR